MNRKEWAARLPLIQAFVEGKTIQVYSFGKWVDGNWEGKDSFYFQDDIERYRVKPEPKCIWLADDGSIFLEEKHAQDYQEHYKIKCTKYVEVVE